MAHNEWNSVLVVIGGDEHEPVAHVDEPWEQAGDKRAENPIGIWPTK
jgi:hypothetical protein